MHTEHAHLRMSETTILCKTQDAANTQHRLVARSGAQAKLHQASNNKTGRLYPAFIVPHWYFLAFAGDRPAIDDGVQGRCRIRLMPSSILQNEKCWPSIVPWRCSYHTTCIISVWAMTGPRCSRPFCFQQKFGSDHPFPFEIQYNDVIFQQKQKGMATRRAIFSIKRKKGSCHKDFLR